MKTVAQIRIDFKDRILSTPELEKLWRADIRESKQAGTYVYPEVLPEPEYYPNKEKRSDLATMLRALHWDAFFTATFKQHQRYSATAIDRVQRVLSEPRLRPTKSFIAAEQHMLGGWHCHGLLEFPDTKHAESMVGFQRNNLKALGFNVVSPVGNLDACTVYLSKYLVKDEFHGDWRMTGRKKFWTQ